MLHLRSHIQHLIVEQTVLLLNVTAVIIVVVVHKHLVSSIAHKIISAIVHLQVIVRFYNRVTILVHQIHLFVLLIHVVNPKQDVCH